MVTKVGLTVVT